MLHPGPTKGVYNVDRASPGGVRDRARDLRWAGLICCLWLSMMVLGNDMQAYFMLDEMLLAGELQEPSKKVISLSSC